MGPRVAPVKQRIIGIDTLIKTHKKMRRRYRIVEIYDDTDQYDGVIAYHTEQIHRLKEKRAAIMQDCNSFGRCCDKGCKCHDCVVMCGHPVD